MIGKTKVDPAPRISCAAAGAASAQRRIANQRIRRKSRSPAASVAVTLTSHQVARSAHRVQGACPSRCEDPVRMGPATSSGAKPRLYHTPSSYYSMIARLALAEGGVAHERVFVDIHVRMSQQEPDYVRL